MTGRSPGSLPRFNDGANQVPNRVCLPVSSPIGMTMSAEFRGTRSLCRVGRDLREGVCFSYQLWKCRSLRSSFKRIKSARRATRYLTGAEPPRAIVWAKGVTRPIGGAPEGS